MNRHRNKFFTAIFIPLLLLYILVAGCDRGCFKKETILQPSESSEKKFQLISKWIPPSTNAIIVIDIFRLSHSGLWNDLVNLGKKTVWKNLENAGINFQSDIGMAAVFMEILGAGKIKGPVMLIQGGFNQDIILTRIKSAAAQSKVKLRDEKYKGYKLYSEDEKAGVFGTPYAFALLKNGIIAAAKADDLRWMIDHKPENASALSYLNTGSSVMNPVWGKLFVSDGTSSTLPPPWNGIERVSLEAAIDDDIQAAIVAETKSEKDAKALKTTLDGFKAIEAIQLTDDKNMLETIDKIAIKEIETRVTIEIPKELGLLKLILSKNSDNPNKEDEKKDAE
jgi:hypothetical protein